MTAEMLPSAREALLAKIGADGTQEQILQAIVAYSNLSFERCIQLAHGAEEDGAANSLFVANILPVRVVEHISVNQQYGCWECDFYSYNGYPKLWDELNRLSGVMAYRYVFERMVRQLLPGEQIEHICRNRRCVWWELHLKAVTPEENNRRRIVAGSHRYQPAMFAGSEYEKELRQIGMYPPPW